MKKGQITLFILVGIVVLVIMGLVIYMYAHRVSSEGLENVPAEILPVHQYMEQCFKEELAYTVAMAMSQGGYVIPSTNSLVTENLIVALWKENERFTIPTQKVMEQSMNQYLSERIFDCYNNSPLESQGFQIIVQKRVVKVSLLRDSVDAVFDVPIQVTLESKSMVLPGYRISIPVRYMYVFEKAKEIAYNTYTEFDPTILSGANLNVTALPYRGSVIYQITDANSSYNNQNFRMIFAVSDRLNSPPELEYIPDFVLQRNHQFNYSLSAFDPDGDAITYRSSNQIFRVDPSTGNASITPLVAGDFSIIFFASDGISETNQTVRFHVQE